MRKPFTKISIYCSLFLSLAGAAKAQMADTTTEFKPSGKIWGYTFGDFAYKGSADNLNRGGSNQYTGMAANGNTFQFRRIYLGYNYDITPHFKAEFLLAAEDDFNGASVTQGPAGTSVGDVTAGGKFTPYVKYADVAWKNIWRNADLKIGSQATPSFAKTDRNDQTAEEVWAYRSIERTISDIRRTPSFDLGASIQGWFDAKGNFGYMIMVGNGSSAKPATNSFKWFYGDVYAKFLNKRLIIDLYQDYERLAWGVYVPGAKAGVESLNGPEYSDRNMTKLFVAWNTKPLTIGFEGFQNTILSGIQVTGVDKNTYYRTQHTMAESFYVRGRILSAPNGDPRLGFFARVDNYDPSGDLSSVADGANTAKFTNTVSTYNPATKENFFTFGLDFQPVKNVHFMPNVWINTYNSSLSATGDNTGDTKVTYAAENGGVTGIKGTDAVYRLTFYYIYR